MQAQPPSLICAILEEGLTETVVETLLFFFPFLRNGGGSAAAAATTLFETAPGNGLALMWDYALDGCGKDGYTILRP